GPRVADQPQAPALVEVAAHAPAVAPHLLDHRRADGGHGPAVERDVAVLARDARLEAARPRVGELQRPAAAVAGRVRRLVLDEPRPVADAERARRDLVGAAHEYRSPA